MSDEKTVGEGVAEEPEEVTPDLISKAWRMKTLNQSWDAGVLVANQGRIMFVTRAGPLFDAPIDQVSARWPWWYFGAGVQLTVSGTKHRLYFTAPRGAEFEWRAFAELVPSLAGLVTLQSVQQVREGRASGKAWKALLSR